MPYSDAELELITIANELIDQKLSEQASLFIKQFPPNLRVAQEYFLNYMEYKTLQDKYWKTKSIFEKGKCENKLKDLGEKVRYGFMFGDKNDELIQYLQFHFAQKWLTKDGKFTFKSPELTEALKGVYESQDKEMEKLSKGFSPLEILRAELPTSNAESKWAAYLRGYQAGNIECAIQMADRYLNARMQNKTQELEELKKVGIDEQKIIDIIYEGIAKGMPSAIAAMANYVDNAIVATKRLYDEKTTEEHRIIIADNAKLALSLCSDKNIQKNILILITLKTTPPETSLSATKKTKQIVQKMNDDGLIVNFTKSLQLSKANATTIAKELVMSDAATMKTKLALKSEFFHMIASLTDRIQEQEKLYQNSLASVKPGTIDYISLINKIEPLKEARFELTKLNHSQNDINIKIQNSLDCINKLNAKTPYLSTSNPLKQLMNKIIQTLSGKKNYFKSQATEIAQTGKEILSQFQSKATPSFSEDKEKLSEKTPLLPKKPSPH